VHLEEIKDHWTNKGCCNTRFTPHGFFNRRQKSMPHRLSG